MTSAHCPGDARDTRTAAAVVAAAAIAPAVVSGAASRWGHSAPSLFGRSGAPASLEGVAMLRAEGGGMCVRRACECMDGQQGERRGRNSRGGVRAPRKRSGLAHGLCHRWSPLGQLWHRLGT